MSEYVGKRRASAVSSLSAVADPGYVGKRRGATLASGLPYHVACVNGAPCERCEATARARKGAEESVTGYLQLVAQVPARA
jgi:hypothetical protein